MSSIKEINVRRILDAKKIKNNEQCFLFHLKSSIRSYYRYIHFYPGFFGYEGKRFHKKTKINFEIYDIINWNTVTINTVPGIPKSKGHDRMKFSQLIEYNVGNKVLQNLY